MVNGVIGSSIEVISELFHELRDGRCHDMRCFPENDCRDKLCIDSIIDKCPLSYESMKLRNRSHQFRGNILGNHPLSDIELSPEIKMANKDFARLLPKCFNRLFHGSCRHMSIIQGIVSPQLMFFQVNSASTLVYF